MPDPFAETDVLEPFAGPRWILRFADWIRGHVRLVLAAAVIFQGMVLSSMIVIHSAPLLFGQRIWLHVEPVDPRDLFRGDYVILSYDFSRMPPAGIAGVPNPPAWRSTYRDEYAWLEDRAVYVSLEPEADGEHYRAGKFSVDRPASGLYLKGKFSRSASFGNPLQFGIEAFYVEEGQGRLLEEQRNARQLSAEVAVAPWGQATLCALK
jgi:uncharacterized membrane-anchored protein